MTIFTASNVSRKDILSHKILKQVPDSERHMFRLKTISDLQNQFCKPKVSF